MLSVLPVRRPATSLRFIKINLALWLRVESGVRRVERVARIGICHVKRLCVILRMEEFTFEKLQVWHKARQLVKEVYKLTAKFPASERFALANQLGRAVVSVPSNIAEGCGRPSLKERIHFYEIAYGSLLETWTQLLIASDLGMICEDEAKALKPEISEIARMLSGLRKKSA